MLSIGGANVFDMVYLAGIVAVGVAVIVLWVKMKRDKYGFPAMVAEFESGAKGLPYAGDFEPAQRIPVRKGKLQ